MSFKTYTEDEEQEIDFKKYECFGRSLDLETKMWVVYGYITDDTRDMLVVPDNPELAEAVVRVLNDELARRFLSGEL